MAHRPYVAVIGPSDATSQETRAAEAIGRGLADGGAIVVCGGLGGVMSAACHGASAAAGVTVGLLPGTDRESANEWVQIALPTGLGELRNGLIIRAADAVIAVGHIALRGRSSGVSLDQQTAWVAAFRADHLITRLTVRPTGISRNIFRSCSPL